MSQLDEISIRNVVKFAVVGQVPSKKARRWTKQDIDQLKQLLPFYSPSVIGTMLNRSPNAIKLARKRNKLSASSKSPGWLTANQVRLLLGMADVRPVIGWVKKGFVLGHQITGETTWMIHEISLRRWITSSTSWAYFKPTRIADSHLVRLVLRAQGRWDDEWLSTPQVAEMKGTNSKTVLQAIARSTLPALHIQNKDGRHRGAWAFWAVKRSDAETWMYKAPTYDLMDQTHAFMLLATAVGLSPARIGKLCGMSTATVAQRVRKINSPKHALKLIHKHRLQFVVFEPLLNSVHVDWRKYADRFPHVCRAFERFRAGRALSSDYYLMARILKLQMAASGMKCNINAPGRVTSEGLTKLIDKMRQAGIKPYLLN